MWATICICLPHVINMGACIGHGWSRETTIFVPLRPDLNLGRERGPGEIANSLPVGLSSRVPFYSYFWCVYFFFAGSKGSIWFGYHRVI